MSLWVCGLVKWNKGGEFYKKLNEGKCFWRDNLNVLNWKWGWNEFKYGWLNLILGSEFGLVFGPTYEYRSIEDYVGWVVFVTCQNEYVCGLNLITNIIIFNNRPVFF